MQDLSSGKGRGHSSRAKCVLRPISCTVTPSGVPSDRPRDRFDNPVKR